MSPLLPVLALGGLAFALSRGKGAKAAAATVPTLAATTKPAAGAKTQLVQLKHPWKLVQSPGSAFVDVYAPAGSWGKHAELLVLRYRQGSSPNEKVLAASASGVPANILAAAMSELGVTAAKVTTPTTAGKQLPDSLRSEMLAVMLGLGVDSTGNVAGPVTAEGIRRATELSSRLSQAGYSEASAAMRGYANQAAQKLPTSSETASAVPNVPGVNPTLMAQVKRALELERDPKKLGELRAQLAKAPASAERDMLVGSLDALILQVRSAQVVSHAATEIDQAMKAPAAPPASATGTRILKLASPLMSGPDVKSWQQVLASAGYPVTADGVFGAKTSEATKDWQKKHSLPGDGIVGPATRAKIGTAPTAPMTVPATPKPQADPPKKSPVEVAAEAAATHLLALQKARGVSGAKGKEDRTLIKRFQSAAGLGADGLAGVGTIVALARAGVGTLPAVMYWSASATKAKDLPLFRAQLAQVAESARKAGRTTLAAAIEASAARETGAGGLK